MRACSITVFDTQIHYHLHSRGRPLLFIHGHRSDALRWKGVILFLAKRFRVYAPDLPGFGQSPAFKNQAHTMKNYGRYLNEMVRKLNLQDYILFGGSMGGMIALEMLFQKPKIKPSKLILVGTPYSQKYFQFSPLTKALIFLTKRFGIVFSLAEKVINHDFLIYWILYFSFPAEARKKEIIDYEVKQWRVMPLKIWLETIFEILRVDYSRKNFQTQIPAFLINAKNDQYYDAQKTINGLKRFFPNHQVFWLPFAGHVPKGELKLKHLKEFQSLLDLT